MMTTPRKLTVIVADDNASFRADLIRYVERQVAVDIVGEAKDGLEAIELVRSLHPDLILLDITMPVMGGLEAARHIRSSDPNTKIVFITIHDEGTYQALATALGVDGFISKNHINRDLNRLLVRFHNNVIHQN